MNLELIDIYNAILAIRKTLLEKKDKECERRLDNLIDKLQYVRCDTVYCTELLPKHNVERVDQLYLGKFTAPIVQDIHDIPPMFYWHNGCTNYKSGLYVCITKGFIVRAAYSDVVFGSNKDYTMPCKWEQCRSKTCKYVHKGQIYNRYKPTKLVGTLASMPDDLANVTKNDIKKMLTDSISDLLILSIWYQKCFKDGNLVLSNINKHT
jgi:hypothetical protein